MSVESSTKRKNAAAKFLARHAWLIIAVLLFSVSWLLVATITATDYTDAATIYLGLDSDQPIVRAVSLVRSQNGALALQIRSISNLAADTTLKITNIRDSSSCVEHWKSMQLGMQGLPGEVSATQLTATRVKYFAPHQGDLPIYSVAIKGSALSESTTICQLSLEPVHETYVRRKLHIESTSLRYPFDMDFSTFGGAENIQLAKLHGSQVVDLVQGAQVPSDIGRVLGSGDTMDVSWDETQRQESRDLLLLVIGTILGLATATLLEWIRPFIMSEQGRMD
jgi:hypothetical protein